MPHPPISINLNFEQLLDAVKKLQPSEKLLLNEVLWDDAALIPSEHQIIVLERINKAKDNPEQLIDWDKASKNL